VRPENGMRRAKVLIVDDESANILLLKRLLSGAGYTDLAATTDSREVLPLYREVQPDLILLDLHMPHLDGLEVLDQLAAEIPSDEYVPVLVLTADVTREAKERALRSGAHDFLAKPLDVTEVLLRSRNLLETRSLHLEMDRRVKERTAELEASRVEILERLSRTAEFRDDVTGKHTKRVGELSARLAEVLGLPTEEVARIRRAAPLHDLGKVGIPDDILLKPGRLTPEEFEVMKTHTTLGAELLSGGRSPLMQMAEEIALGHHERWDGAGYPQGKRDEEIPLVARIVAVADFFDALSHDRPYRSALPTHEVMEEIENGRGKHFDPTVAQALLDLGDSIESWK
jgi:putative two-component system response regulator